VAFALIGLAGSHASMGNGAEASRCLAELQSRVAAPALDTFQFWLLGLRASLAGLAGDFAQAVELSASALEAARRSADVPDTACAERALGHWQHMAGNLDAAMEHTLNALELLERARTTRGVRFLHAIAQMSVLENQLRGAAHARPLAQQAVALANELQVGPDYPEPQVRQALRQAIELAG
jgi:tetratricopeptide (TPR) repeat protein